MVAPRPRPSPPPYRSVSPRQLRTAKLARSVATDAGDVTLRCPRCGTTRTLTTDEVLFARKRGWPLHCGGGQEFMTVRRERG